MDEQGVPELGRPHHLMVNLQKSPVGVDRDNARFSWRLPATVTEQDAYQIQLGTDTEACARGAVLWDSGRTVGATSTSVARDGLALNASSAYWWRVRVWAAGAPHATEWSDPARLITAISNVWPAEAIWAGPTETSEDALPRWALLRHEFELPSGEVVAAFVEAIGDSPENARQYVFKLWCNREVGGRGSVRPIDNEIRYHTYDVADKLIPGRRNALAALCWAETGQRFAARLIVLYSDGRRFTVATSRDWRGLDGGTLLPGLGTVEGGWYRAPLENWTMPAVSPGWTGPGYSDADWRPAVIRPAVDKPIPALANIEQELVSPASVDRIGLRHWLIDLGRVIVGGLRLCVDGREGDQVRVVLGEELEGARVRSPLRGGNIYDETWTLCTGPQEIEHWGYRGFRYAELTSTADLDFAGSVSAVQLRSSDLETEATFDCSRSELVRVWDLCRDTIETTSLDLHQDTPTRERGPYEGDEYVNQLGQYALGGGYALARYSHRHLTYNPTWPTEYRLMASLCAWSDYLVTGDASDLATDYDLWISRNLDSSINEIGLVEKDPDHTDQGLGRDIVDWPPANRDGYEFTRANTVVNAFQCAAYKVLSRIADVIGRTGDHARLARQAAELEARLNQHLLDRERAAYRDGVGSTHRAQHATAIPTALGLAPKELRPAIGDNLADQGIRTSIYAVQFLLDALYETGHDEAALRLMTGRHMPGWIDAMDRLGATLTPEAWDPSIKPNMSFSHAWGTAPINVINRHLIGLNVVKPGASQVLIRPQPAGLTWFRAKVPTIRGPIGVEWDMRSTAGHCTVELPGNMTAVLDLPAMPSLSPTVTEAPGPLAPPMKRDGRLRWEPIRPGTTTIAFTTPETWEGHA